LGRIPVLVDGELVLYDSLAISLHLGFGFPDAGLCPKLGTHDLAEYFQWLVLANSDLDRVVGRFYAAQRARLIGDTRPALTLTQDSFLKLLSIYDARLEHSAFLVRDKLSGADIFTASIFAFADSIGLVPIRGPVRTWLDRMTRLPSYARALAG
jgi:glutathione S-transferase